MCSCPLSSGTQTREYSEDGGDEYSCLDESAQPILRDKYETLLDKSASIFVNSRSIRIHIGGMLLQRQSSVEKNLLLILLDE